MAQVTETAIANKAFILLGSAQRLSSFSDSSQLAAQVRDVWEVTVPAVLSAHPWNFAVLRASVDRDEWTSTTAAFLYRYTFPNDKLRWLVPDREDADWFEAEEEGGYLLSNDEGPIVIRYIHDQRDISRWSPTFIDALVYRLAYELAESVAASQSLRDRMWNGYGEAISLARRTDGLATGRNRRASPHSRSRFVRRRHQASSAGWND